MRKTFFMIIFLFLFVHTRAQVQETTTEQQLENSTANNEDVETEDDSYLQQLQQFLKNPVNLNLADEPALKELGILTPIQVQHFILYRNLVGRFIDVHELQAIPGWDLQTIQKLRPYVTVGSEFEMLNAFSSRLKKGEHGILIRASQVLERSAGYLADSSSATNFYPGSPQKILLRYKYACKDLLQYGIVAEKDAGEQFFKGKQKQGFDFYSFHLFARKAGIIRSLAIGDFTVNLGQGLTQWQSLAFKKSTEVIRIKRESEVLRPYSSAGEINFHRGAGITLARSKWQLTAFISYRKVDANFVADTSLNRFDHISSLQTSGYHRTKSESGDKGIQRQFAWGGNFSYRYKRIHIGVNGIHYKFRLPLIRSGEPYNRYSLSGSSFGNYSLDYSYTFKNFHFFGEAAFSSSFSKAFVNGLIISVSSVADLGLLYRNISRSYQSLYTAAFTESTQPVNENGFYAGLTLRPGNSWQVDAYADLYEFPWLKYRVDAPSIGSDYLLQVTYRPHRHLEIYTRYHAESKPVNENPGNLPLSPVLQQARQNWRTQISYRVSREVTLRNRTEVVWFDRDGPAAEQGVLIFFDFLYKPVLKPYSGTVRLLYFETGGYNSRLYAYENDVLYSYSIPVFYDKGYRYYININYDFGKRLSAWARWAQTVFSGKSLIGSGLDEIKGNLKSELKLQLLYKF